MRLCVIRPKGSEYKVIDYYKKLPTSPYSKLNEAIDLCRMRLERTIYEVLYKLKVPFIGLWLVW